MEQQRALNALEPYLALSKNARTPAAASDLITQATSDPSTYVFAELLQTPQIQSLRHDPTYTNRLTLLELFSWGTWHSYKTAPNLPKLNEKQTRKLKLLSLISLLSNPDAGSHTQSYTHLQRGLDIESQVELESLLTTALSAGLVTGHLDPLHQRVAVSSVAPLRDLSPGSAPQLVSVLGEWEERCDGALKEMEQRVQAIRDNARKRGEREKARREAFEEKLGPEEGDEEEEEEKNGVKVRGRPKRKEPGGRGGEADVMDVDDAGKGGLRSGAAKSAKKLFGKSLR